MNKSSRISKRSAGQFDPKNWFSEGDGLFASAAKTRETWTDHRRAFSQTVRKRRSEKSDRASDWNLLTGLPRASMLLLAYSVEMYLKAGMAKAYYGCSARMFERDVKGRLGHRLVSMAKELAFNLKDGDETNLALLKDMMLFDARYPVFVPEGASYADTVNRQTRRIWSSSNFEDYSELISRIKQHSQLIDSDSSNPASCNSYRIDRDGYLTFRIGGNLPPRITYRVSLAPKSNCKTPPDEIKALFVSPQYPQLSRYWERAWIYEDGEEKTYCHAQPLS